MDNFLARIVPLVICMVLTAGCGGGGGGAPALSPAPAAPTPSGGVDRGGVAVGTISGFGSIIVNGVHYDTTGTQFTIDDSPGSESDLAVGHVVTVVGTISADGSSGAANSVFFDNDIEGPVQSIDLSANVLIVAGQTIRVSADTVFDNDIVGASLGGLAIDDRVEVSGFFNADGDLLATRIERDSSGTEVEIKGTVSALDTSTKTFAIGQLSVDYSGATLEDFAAGGPQDGDFVEVHGMSFAATGELIATRVENEGGSSPGSAGDNIEVEGFITAFRAQDSFDVGNRSVVTTASTAFENGTAADLALNVKIEAEGNLDSAGILVATKIEFKLAGTLRVSALVDAVDTATGIVTVLGLDVRVGPTTQLEDESEADIGNFSLADLAVGNFVEVRGAVDATGAVDILASRLERDEPEDEVELRGFVESFDVTTRSLVIFGVSCVAESAGLSVDAFFAALTTGALVQVKGQLIADGVISVDEFEFENE